ncbi:hypothetical protein OROMI_028811 [Orobanche minor]
MEGITPSLSFVNHIFATCANDKLTRQSNYNNALPFKDHRLIIEYQSDDIAGIIFDDVLSEDLKDVVYVISLLGILMQQHIFGNSSHGDSRNYLSKKEKQTFMEILLTVGADRPDDMLFVTSNLLQAFVAKASAMTDILALGVGVLLVLLLAFAFGCSLFQDQPLFYLTGHVATHTSQPLKKNLFLQNLHLEDSADLDSSKSHTELQDKDIVECLEKGVQYWTDFSKSHYHPQSPYKINGLWSEVKEFNICGVGREAFSGGLHAEEINERLRFFFRNVIVPRGFQNIIDNSGGFSGIAGEFLENIADEYTNIPVVLYSVCSPESVRNPGSHRLAISRKPHDAISFSKLSTFCKLIVPLGLPSLSAGYFPMEGK